MHTTVASAMSASFSVIAERFRRAGQIDRAVSLCREGLEAYPDHLSARVTLGCALLDLGQHVEAHRHLQAVLKRAPDNLAAIRGLAELHARGLGEQDVHDMEAAHEIQMADQAQAQAVHAAAEAEPASVMAFAGAEPLNELEALHEFDPVMAPEPMVPLDVLPLDDFDPQVAVAPAEPLQFEIEDVLPDASEGFTLGDEPESELEFDLGSDMSEAGYDIDPSVPAEPGAAAPPAEPVPVPQLSAGPIAVLDEWLTRIRARRSELLSEYAAS